MRLDKEQKAALDAIALVEASLSYIKPYEVKKRYSPKELESYDALGERFRRAVEVSIKFFRSYEKLMHGENSETLRDLLHRMEKLHFIDSVVQWIDMRDVRNRIVHDYLPEDIKEIYDSIMGSFGRQLLKVKEKINTLTLESKEDMDEDTKNGKP